MSAVNEIIDQTNFDNSLLKILDDMINGESSETKSMKNLIAMVSQTDSTALILGETGTGKDIVAQAIHKCSKKKGHFWESEKVTCIEDMDGTYLDHPYCCWVCYLESQTLLWDQFSEKR